MKLKFIGVGLEKAATTAIFKVLESEDSIFMPPEKEAQFFGHVDRVEEGWTKYWADFFGDRVPSGVICGTITPQYFKPGVAREIAVTLGVDTKIFMIIRDPIERLYSKKKMEARRQGLEYSESDFLSYLETGDLSKVDAEYLRYAPVLNEYHRAFGESFLVLQYQWLETDAGQNRLLAKLAAHINADITASKVPVVFKSGLPKSRFATRVRNSELIRFLARKILSRRQARLVSIVFDRWNVKPTSSGVSYLNVDTFKNVAAICSADRDSVTPEYRQHYYWIT